MKLWFEKHQNYHYQLYEHEDDEIEDFEGHDLIEMQPE
jgi:predicted membrane protein